MRLAHPLYVVHVVFAFLQFKKAKLSHVPSPAAAASSAQWMLSPASPSDASNSAVSSSQFAHASLRDQIRSKTGRHLIAHTYFDR